MQINEISYQVLPSGRVAVCEPYGRGFRVVEIVDYEDTQPSDGPTCSICDALGHGYPGGGPCPLEDRGYIDDDRFDLAGRIG